MHDLDCILLVNLGYFPIFLMFTKEYSLLNQKKHFIGFKNYCYFVLNLLIHIQHLNHETYSCILNLHC